jgi:hypothetical protein
MNIETYLQKIDLTLKDKSTKDIYLIYIMIIVVVFFLNYIIFWKTSEATYRTVQNKLSIIQNKLIVDNKYLKENTSLILQQLDIDIQNLKTDVALNVNNNSYIKNKIQDISSLNYNEATWGAYLNSISVNAKKHNIKILNFSNEILKSNKVFDKMININLQSTGSYNNTIKFINSLEQSKFVVDIYAIDIQAKATLITDLNISVWGIRY